jgi:hypothetical protein
MVGVATVVAVTEVVAAATAAYSLRRPQARRVDDALTRHSRAVDYARYGQHRISRRRIRDTRKERLGSADLNVCSTV